MSKAALNSPCYVLEKPSELQCVWHWWNLPLCWWIWYKVFCRHYNPLEQLKVNLWAISCYVEDLVSVIICDRILRYSSLHGRETLWNTYRIICNTPKVILWPIGKLLVHDSYFWISFTCAVHSSQMFAEASCHIVRIISKLLKVQISSMTLAGQAVFIYFSSLRDCSEKVFFLSSKWYDRLWKCLWWQRSLILSGSLDGL